MNNGNENRLILNSNGSIQRDTGGNARGTDAVDLQRNRFFDPSEAADIEYILPTTLPNPAATATDLGGGSMETDNNGTMNWRQSTVVTATNLNFGTVAAQSSSDVTVAVTGAAVGDIVNLGVNNAAVAANSCYTAWVSATDTVTVRFNNYSAGAITPTTVNTFKMQITK